MPVLVCGGIGIAAGSLAGLAASESVGLFGFMETGYRSSIVLSMAFDVAAAALLAAFLVLRRPSRTGRRRALIHVHKEISQ